ncbi:MAG: sporulation protein YqfD [Clostridiales bacterium]|nr:sporulation protein YqfD [Clostridiales bacterium]
MKSTVEYEVIGLNQLKLINTFKKEGVIIKKLIRQNQKLMTFCISGKDRAKVTALMDSQGFSYAVVNEESFFKSIKNVLPRLGLVAGLLVMIILSVIASNYLWKIEISGNDRVDELTIIRTLGQSGVYVGQRKSFDNKQVEEALMALEDISAVSAQIVGTTLKVDIVESALISPPKQTGDIISLYDAEITRIIVNSGSAKVKIGDRIPIGATLIEGVEYNTEGNPILDVLAQGSVYGKVNFTYSETTSLCGGYIRTGNVTSNTILKLFGLSIGKELQVEGEYEAEKTLTRIGSFFPLYAETTRYYELEKLPDITLEDLKEQVKDKAVNGLIIRAGGSAIVATANATPISGNVYRITVHIEAEVSIGGKRID